MPNRKHLERGVAIDALVAATVAASGDGFAVAHLAGDELAITWEVILPGVAPATLQVDLEGCNGDPSVEANWFQLDTYNTAAATMRHVVNKRVLWLRARLVLITTPAGGVSVRILV